MRTYVIFAIVLLTAACEEVVDRPVVDPSEPVLVVEGVVSNQLTNHRIRLSMTSQQQNGVNAAPATSATVRIHGGGRTYVLSETTVGSGEYFTIPTRFEFGATFTLEIQLQGKTYLAQDRSVPVELLTPFNYVKAGEQYRLVLGNSGAGAHYVSHDIDWGNTPSCSAGTSCKGQVNFYDLKTIDVNEITKPQKEDFTFPLGSRVIRTKYSVSPLYRTFLRSVLSETEWRGSAFDVDRANAPTNLTGGAIGFFAVTSVVSDTTMIVEKP